MKTTLRIVLAIAAKDITDALKNKTILSVIIGAAMLLLPGQALPWLARLNAKPSALIYDAGRSRWVAQLRRDETVAVQAVGSTAELEAQLAGYSGALLGLSLPADLEQRLAAGQPVKLEGRLAHWVSAEDAEELRAVFERKLGEIAGRPVQIALAEQRVYPAAESSGQTSLSAWALIIVMLVIGGVLTPLLFLEERQMHTLEALLVSPATAGQVVAGKALAGLAYELATAVVGIVFFGYLVAQWGLAILAMALAALLAVALGLLLGTLSTGAQTLSPWFALALLPFFAPIFLQGRAGWEWVNWIPTALLAQMLRASFAVSVEWPALLGAAGGVVGWMALFLGVVVWRVQRMMLTLGDL